MVYMMMARHTIKFGGRNSDRAPQHEERARRQGSERLAPVLMLFDFQEFEPEVYGDVFTESRKAKPRDPTPNGGHGASRQSAPRKVISRGAEGHRPCAF